MSQELVTRVLRLRESGKVERCHTLPRHGTYSLGQHVFDILALLITLHPDPSPALFRAVVLHDAHERWIGDIPGALKYLSPELAEYLDEQKGRIDRLVGYEVDLTPDEKKWLKALDRIEFYLWCQDQTAMGNRHVAGRLEAVIRQLSETPMPEPCADFLQNYEWRRTHDNDVR